MISLLTEKDIKNFILDQIDKIDCRQTGCFRKFELAKKLNMHPNLIAYHAKFWTPSYIKGTRKYYDIQKVLDYFKEKEIDIQYNHDVII